MKMFYSAKKLLLLTSVGVCFVEISAQTTKPEHRKVDIQMPRPGVDNQRQFDSIKNLLDQQRLTKKKWKNPKKKNRIRHVLP